MSDLMPSLSDADRSSLTDAVRRLQSSRGLVVRAADLLATVFGSAAAYGLRNLNLSSTLSGKLQGIAEQALARAFDVAVLGIAEDDWAARPRRARLVAAFTGAVGGFTGLPGFLPDATLTTLLIMRNIAAIAREEGEDLQSESSRQACLEVFAFGGPPLAGETEEPEFGYWSMRFAMHGRPMMLLLSQIAARYGLRISEKLAVQAVPLLGAASGALVNSVFLDHYRNLARVHFTIRRLERGYGGIEIRQAADQIAADLRLARRS